MSYSSSETWPEPIRRFVYHGEPESLATLIRETCLEPAIEAAAIGQVKSRDAAVVYGLGGEILRYTYWQGNLQTLGEPPLLFDQARKILTDYSAFSDLIAPREHLAMILLGAVSCAYEKGCVEAFGKVT